MKAENTKQLSREKTMPWYVLYTRSRHEKKVDTLLKQQNINSFFPQIKEIKQWSDRKKKMLVPLFPNYLFVQSDPRDFWKIKSTPGIVGFVGQRAEKGPVPVSEKVTGVEGVFKEHCNKNMLVIEVELIQRSICVEINPAHLKVLNTCPQ